MEKNTLHVYFSFMILVNNLNCWLRVQNKPNAWLVVQAQSYAPLDSRLFVQFGEVWAGFLSASAIAFIQHCMHIFDMNLDFPNYGPIAYWVLPGQQAGWVIVTLLSYFANKDLWFVLNFSLTVSPMGFKAIWLKQLQRMPICIGMHICLLK